MWARSVTPQSQNRDSSPITGSFDRGAAVTVLICAAVALAGCSRSDTAAPANQQASQPTSEVKVALSEAGCEPQPASVPAGPVRFMITNSGASHVTEVELLRDGKIVGEKEGVKPGSSGDLVLRLDGGGAYSVHCAGGAKNDWPLTVTGGAGQPGAGPANATLAAATQGYHDYVVAEVDQLVTSTKQFTDAVRAGDMDKAKQLYPGARVHYESIEPVAESFGDLDPQIDARIDDVDNPADWTGFHRIEKALWQDKTLNGMGPLADKLDADIATLKSKVATETYQPAQLGNGAGELLNEVSTTKITGEEDRYSHTDLWDLAANVDGARKCFELLKPALAAKDPALVQQLETRFADVTDRLSKYRQGDGYVDYSTVAQDQRRELANAVNALAEPMSHVAGRVV
ncbi:MAG: iron uptake system protein EfeO [Pseudonocardiales bacterium]|nr:iron uptake system protein EfeO [Pseudonocardiales bacterium]MBV9650873.1 iron uptake system protein EfeO [Pseudonocardiales bacterium]